MERDQALGNFSHPVLETAEPHFDDERTLLSAQPVVPLAAVSRIQNRRRLVFVGAFAVAALLGAGAALALVRVRQPAVTDSMAGSLATEDTAQAPIAQKGAATGAAEDESSSDAQQPENGDVNSEAAIVIREHTRPKRAVTNRRSSTPQVEISMRPIDRPSDDDQPRLLDQWQERRQRRVNRKPDNHHRSELFRIREIFEGPRPRRQGN